MKIYYILNEIVKDINFPLSQNQSKHLKNSRFLWISIRFTHICSVILVGLCEFKTEYDS